MTPQYQALGANTYRCRRSIADALDVLSTEGSFAADDHAVIRVGAFPYMPDYFIGFPWLEFFGSEGIAYSVTLPAALHFRISIAAFPTREYNIFLLAGAAVNGTGLVRLADGRTLRGIDVVPALLNREPTELDWDIIYAIIKLHGGVDKYMIEYMPPSGIRNLKYDKLAEIRLPSLKTLVRDLKREFPELDVSPQKIADALWLFRMRAPKYRRLATL